MKILIIGAAGMIGRKLTKRLLEAEAVDHLRPSTLILADIAAPSIDESTHQSSIITPVSIDLSDETAVKKLVANRPDVIFQLAAIVSAEAEANMPKGYRVNLDGMRYLLEAIAAQHSLDGYKPKFIFASSIAVYGAPFPEAIGDEFHQTPMTSYGTQKAMGELMLADYNRRSFIEGIGLRLPTICVRPGKPNKAASGFFSNIIREPINGQSAQLPVDRNVRHWFASPRAAVNFLLHATTLDAENIGARCNITLPGLCATVDEQIESLKRVVGNDAAKLITHKPDPVIQNIVRNWPQNFKTDRASQLGFKAELNFDELINVYLEDDYTQSTGKKS